MDGTFACGSVRVEHNDVHRCHIEAVKATATQMTGRGNRDIVFENTGFGAEHKQENCTYRNYRASVFRTNIISQLVAYSVIF